MWNVWREWIVERITTSYVQQIYERRKKPFFPAENAWHVRMSRDMRRMSRGTRERSNEKKASYYLLEIYVRYIYDRWMHGVAYAAPTY